MTTLAELLIQPASGLQHIDALLASGPAWNWLTPARNKLIYTFALSPLQGNEVVKLPGPQSAFNVAQQAASTALLGEISALTGIQFSLTSDPRLADLHFAAGDLVNVGGFCSWNYRYSTRDDNIDSYYARARIFIDNAELASITNAPTLTGGGYELLLHEIGHALGLKHPFEGAVQLPVTQDNTSNTLLSYTHVGGPYGSFNAYDVAALMWLYGGDGLGEALGQGSPGAYLMGTASADMVVGGAGNDHLEGLAGNDTFDGGAGDDIIDGGAGLDRADYGGARAQHQVGAVAGVITMLGGQGADKLYQVERLQFADQSLAFDFDGAAGITARVLGAIFGAASVANQHYTGIVIGLLDGGISTSALMQLALDARLGPDFSRSAEIDLLFRNLADVAPTADEMAYWLGALETQQFTPVTLALAAAELPLNAGNIDLVGLAQTGLAFAG